MYFCYGEHENGDTFLESVLIIIYGRCALLLWCWVQSQIYNDSILLCVRYMKRNRFCETEHHNEKWATYTYGNNDCGHNVTLSGK